MQAFDLDSRSPEGPHRYPPADHWSIPFGRLAGIQFYVSYSVFVALAVLAALVASVQGQQGNSDLPLIAAMAVSVWATGWLLQVIVFFAFHLTSIGESDTLTIGLLGVEVAYPLSNARCWTAGANLASAMIALTSLVVFGIGCLATHMLTTSEQFGSLMAWGQQLAIPSFGMHSPENFYLSAAWLFWIQAACQAFPMPRNLGRGAIASALVMFAAEAGEDLKLKLLRRTIQLIAIVTLVLAMATMLVEPKVFFPPWPILILLSLILWHSSTRPDLIAWIRSVEVAKTEHLGLALNKSQGFDEGVGRGGRFGKWLESARMHRKRKRAKAVWKREREEALDVARLDHVLKLVSDKGAEALSAEDRALWNESASCSGKIEIQVKSPTIPVGDAAAI